MPLAVVGFAYSRRFEQELLAASPDTQAAVKAALEMLQANSQARSLRLHPLQGYGKPTIWKIDVFTNKSWQITFEFEAGIAHLKRLAPHKTIDRNPR